MKRCASSVFFMEDKLLFWKKRICEEDKGRNVRMHIVPGS